MASQRSAALQVAFDPNWGQQAAFGTARTLSDLSARLNVITRRHIARTQKVEEVLDCSGRAKIGERILSRIGRLSLELEATPRNLGGLTAFALGVAASPSHSIAADEVQHVDITGGTASGGTFRLQFNYVSTGPIAYNASTATVQTALQALETVGSGNLLVSGTPGAWVVTGAGAFAGISLPQLVKTNVSLTGTGTPTITVSTVTEGGPARDSHLITQLNTGYQKPVTTFVVGFEGEDPIVFQDAALDSLTVTARVGEKIRVAADFVGRADYAKATGFTFPACANETALTMADGRLMVGGTDKLALARQIELTYNNGLLIDSDPYTAASIDPTRIETADRVISRLAMILEGTIGDANFQLANANAGLGTDLATLWRLGVTTSGIEYSVPEGKLKAEDDPQGFDGEANRATLGLFIDPRKTDTNAAKPISATSVNSQTTAFLLPA